MTSPTVAIDAARYLGVERTQRVKDELAIVVTPKSFPPYLDDLAADWVSSVAVPAFRLLAQRRGPVTGFASIGTGTGLDALGGIEVFAPQLVGITDVDDEIVDSARANILANLRDAGALRLLAGTGDLLSPLAAAAPRFDVIYENLPNVPSNGSAALAGERASSSFFGPRAEAVPQAVQSALLTLHYLALRQAHEFLVPGGVVLSMLGARVALRHFLEMSAAAGYEASFLSYGWKLQAEAVEILSGHAEWQRRGLGPFRFYRLEPLQAAFAGLPPEQAARQALEIEAGLLPHALDAEAALALHRQGVTIGHTYAVLHSRRP
ncbi:class I SAM-dependent methyltransferase [Rubrivivax gelatinosus]|uniref:hypothetical protein n=1 Tax=Rubrivivax gelatinosus TaxID=28068 RepID=UPI0002FE9669|nr:hypothetical protein [Rubrivivax gelatinosus]